MEVKINDTAFAHTDYSTLQKSKFFKWVRTNEPMNVCFFTDHSLSNVLNSKDKIKVAWLIEPRAINPYSYDFIEHNHNLFDYVLTYDDYLLTLNNKFKFYPHGGCWLSDSDKQIFKKDKFCSIIASSKNQTEGHRLRHAIINSRKDIDIFGNGYNYIENKITGLEGYKFSIVIENSKQDIYFTEKLIDTLLTGTIPLYWGSNKINYFFKDIPCFNTIEDLNLLLEYYKNNTYPYDNIIENYKKALEYTIPEDYIFQNYKELFI